MKTRAVLTTLLFGLLVLSCMDRPGSTVSSIPNAWQETAFMNVERTGHAAVALESGGVLVAGGRDASWEAVAHCEVFEPGTATWQIVSPMVRARVGHRAVLLPSGRVFVSGGLPTQTGDPTPCELYDPVADLWEIVDGPPGTPLGWHFSAALRDGRVLVLERESCWFVDPIGATWTAAAPPPIWVRAATALLDGRLFAVRTGATLTGGAQAATYDPAHDRWTRTTDGPWMAVDGATTLASGLVLIMGEQVDALYGPTTDRWEQDWSRTCDGRTGFTITSLGDGRAILAGGFEYLITSWSRNLLLFESSACELFSPSRGWTTDGAGRLHDTRVGHTATLIPGTRRVLVAGGHPLVPTSSWYEAGPPLASAELFDEDNVR